MRKCAAKITGFQEDTLYTYALGMGPEHTFGTRPPRDGSDFTVFAEADLGASNDVFRVASPGAIGNGPGEDWVPVRLRHINGLFGGH